ncbi:MAG: hypothetical protein ISR61_05075 [Desulfobacteraceae bacterium]|nr:hypothetical protein [Deltaproteobacteria bacterium]MBL6978301.1 hypothetical protein [Desulfobacteraceae bacterium]MBL7217228.1 hypothetical protein [Desulfobacteraceae bacterium]
MVKLKINIQRKYLFTGLAILLCLALIYRFFPLFQERVFPAQEIALKERRLIKYRKMVAASSNLNERLASLDRAFKELESRLLSGRTPPLAAVEIQKIVQEIAEKSHVQRRSVKVLTPMELEQKKYLSIPVEFYIYPTIRQLKEVLYLIETSPKFLAVRRVRIIRHNKVGRQFRCYITVAGIMRRAES